MIKGFFDLPETLIKKKIKAYNCDYCNLYKQVHSPKMTWTGKGKLKTLIIGEAPGREEDITGIQFKGQAGGLFRNSLKPYGLQLDRDFWKINAINCRPTDSKGNNREPTRLELQCCLWSWRKAIEELKPQFIWLMGGKIVETFFESSHHNFSTDNSITRWRGLCIPDKVTKAWILPMFHPSFSLLRNKDAEITFTKDLENAISQFSLNPPIFEDWRKKVTISKNFDDIMGKLKNILDFKPPIAIDYEANRLKPQYKGSLLYTISFSGDEEEAFAFPFQFPGFWDSQQLSAITEIWIKILSDIDIKKTAQNIQMEDSWSREILLTQVQNWDWDTMVASHIIDERDKYTSLDFQVFINWGYEYGEIINPFKKSGKDGFNQLHKVPLEELLGYNGLDSLFTNKLKHKQIEKIKTESPNLLYAYQLFHEGILCFSDIESEGISVDGKYYEKTSKSLEKRIEFLENKLYSSEEVKLFKDKTGHKIKLNSPDQISELLFNVLKLPSNKKTNGGGDSVDFEVLSSIDTPFTNNLVKMRKLIKLKKTYVDGILNLMTNGKIYPSQNLHLARTYRSTSSDPNFQNIPVHDEEANQLIRSGIIPSPGNMILEVDYKQMELCILACYSKDIRLIKYIEEGRDIHQEEADELGISRYDAKNKFVFAEVYGSYWGNIQRDLVKSGYDISERKVRKVEGDFWKKFPGVLKWVQEIEESYKKNGYVEMFQGFRRRGYLTSTQIRNTPIQGTAFHCLLWSLNRINLIRRLEGWKTKICGQIHDDIFYDQNPEELKHVVEISREVMTKEINIHSWIIVPLSVNFEATEVDKSWYTKRELNENDGEKI